MTNQGKNVLKVTPLKPPWENYRPKSWLRLRTPVLDKALYSAGTVKLTDLVPNQRLGKSLSC